LRFALEKRQRLRITANFLRQKLRATKRWSRVSRLCRPRPCTRTELIGDSIVGDGLTDHWDDILRSDLGEVNGKTWTRALVPADGVPHDGFLV